jgi:hypothetical protein
VNKSFGPALNAAVNLLAANFQRDVGQIVQEEAKSIGLPEGWQSNIQDRVWVLPDEKPEP